MIPTILPLWLTTALFAAQCAVAKPALPLSAQAGFSFDELLARWDCDGQYCGYDNQYCCTAGTQCSTSADVALCVAGPTQAPSGGHWEYYTTTYVETGLVTVTTVMSSYVSGGASAASPTAALQCNQVMNEAPCGDVCCAGWQYCYSYGKCVANGAGATPTPTPEPAGGSGSSPGSSFASSGSAGAPFRPTSSSLLYVTSTQSAVTTTVPFETPVATGANITLTEDQMSGSSGLSGGAIAGIVIGVLLALALLALLCFCCCIKGLLDGIFAIFGLGKKKRTEVEEYERRSHHSRGGGRTWYGAARPSRVSRTEERKSHEGRELLGIGAGLAALWAVLGLKRQRDHRRREEKQQQAQSEYSYNSSYDYTSESSASSDDRRTRQSNYTRGTRR